VSNATVELHLAARGGGSARAPAPAVARAVLRELIAL
jgi:hypothetical protein